MQDLLTSAVLLTGSASAKAVSFLTHLKLPVQDFLTDMKLHVKNFLPSAFLLTSRDTLLTRAEISSLDPDPSSRTHMKLLVQDYLPSAALRSALPRIQAHCLRPDGSCGCRTS